MPARSMFTHAKRTLSPRVASALRFHFLRPRIQKRFLFPNFLLISERLNATKTEWIGSQMPQKRRHSATLSESTATKTERGAILAITATKTESFGHIVFDMWPIG